MRKGLLFCTSLFLGIAMLLGQQRAISGVVVSADDNEPIVGASVVVKGTTTGAATDLDGKFRLSVPNGATLVVSFVGYQDRSITIGSSSDLKIQLQVDNRQLESLVVVGYGTGRKVASLTSSVAVVNTKDLQAKPVSNAFDAIQGKVAGLQIATATGEPSQLSSVRLHGTGSLGAEPDPLYIVDGAPVSAETIRGLNNNDFESVQVLKDAAATSIYGARAANGVIYITTRRGRAGDRANVTLRAQYGISNLANRDYFDQMMTRDEIVAFWRKSGLRSEAAITSLLSKYNHDTRWVDYYYLKNRPAYSLDASISGGAGRTSYFISAGLFDQQGLRYGSNYKKNTFRVNLNTELNRYISIGTNNSLAIDSYQTNPYTRNNTNGGLSLLALPMYSPYDANGNEYYGVKIPGWNRYSPRYLADSNPDQRGYTTLSSSSFLQVVPIENLTLRAQVAVEHAEYRRTEIRKPSYAEHLHNGWRAERFDRSINFTSTNTAEYKFNLHDKHHFTALVGHEYVDHSESYFRGEGQGLGNDNLIELGLTTKEKKLESEVNEYAFLSYFGRLSYDLDDKYFLDLTYRNDASSRFSKKNRNGHFWALGAMWAMKKEGFLSDTSWLNDLRLKLSIGTQGNAAIGNYGVASQVGVVGQHDSTVGWRIKAKGNPDLTWEKQFKMTFGFETRLFDKLSLNVELYHRLTSDMLMDVPYPHYSGFINDLYRSEIVENVGKYQNRGIDIKLNYDIYRNRNNDGVSVYANFNYNKDKVIELFDGHTQWTVPNTGVTYVIGQPVMFFYPINKGVNPQTGMYEWYVPGADTSVTTKDKVTTEFSDALEQNTGIQRYTPVTGGFGLSADYKGFYLQTDFAFALGKHMVSNDNFFFANPGLFTGFNAKRDVNDFWKQAGDVTRYPSLSSDQDFSYFDSLLIENASYMRLKNLTLGYTVPAQFLNKQKIVKSAKLFVTARNLFTVTSFTGPDPELENNLALGLNPNTKQLSLGVEISF